VHTAFPSEEGMYDEPGFDLILFFCIIKIDMGQLFPMFVAARSFEPEHSLPRNSLPIFILFPDR
jgi:hypothetical protein